MRKILLPVLGDTLNVNFSDSRYFKIYHIKNQTVIKEELIDAFFDRIESFSNWLYKKGITDVIARNIEADTIKKLNQNKINVFVGVELENPKDLVQEYIDGTLETCDKLFDK